MRSRAQEISNYHDLGHLDIDLLRLDRDKSQAHLLLITESKQRLWINLKLFKIVSRDGASENLLYIADRYVAPSLRGNKLGDQLLKIAENIARANGCSRIFAQLVPEEASNLALLEEGMQKAGFITHSGRKGETLAEKQL